MLYANSPVLAEFSGENDTPDLAGISAIKLEYSFDILMTLVKDETRIRNDMGRFKKAAAGIRDTFEHHPPGTPPAMCKLNELDRQYRLGLPDVFRAAFTNLLKVLYIDVRCAVVLETALPLTQLAVLGATETPNLILRFHCTYSCAPRLLGFPETVSRLFSAA
jgi:hypothetical protein